MKKLLLLSIIALLAFSSCKKWQHKYPEDPARTKNTPTERLTGKWWTLQSASVNGKDYTDSVYQIFGKYQIYFSSAILSTDFKGDKYYSGNVKTDLEPPFSAVWRFTSNEEYITIASENGNNSNKNSVVPCYIGGLYAPFTISKLTKDEFKISVLWGNGFTIFNTFKIK